MEEGEWAGRLPGNYFHMFRALCRACRLHFRPRNFTKQDILVLDYSLGQFCTACSSLVHCDKADRGSMCRLPVAQLLDVASNIRNGGPEWVHSQIAIERYINTFPMLISSISSSHAALTRSVTRKYIAELASCFWESCAVRNWEKEAHPAHNRAELHITQSFKHAAESSTGRNS